MAKRSVLIELGAKFGPQGKRAFANVQKRMKQLGRLGRKALNLGSMLGAGVAGAVAATVAGLVKITKDAVSAGDALDKMSKRTGLAVEFLNGMKHAADLSGTSIDSFEKAIKKSAQSAMDASDGLKTYTRLYDRLGVTVTNQDGSLKGAEQLFTETATALGSLENETEKAAIASKLFGRAGTQLLPMLNSGKDGIKAMMDESKELGFVWDKQTAAQAAELNDQFSRIKLAAGGIATTIGVELMPEIKGVTDDVLGWFKANKDLISQDIKAFAAGAAEGFALLRDGLKEIKPIVEPIADAFKTIQNALEGGFVGDFLADRASTRAQQEADEQIKQNFESESAQARLAEVAARARASRGLSPTGAAAQGEADAAREQTIAQEAVDQYRAGRKQAEARKQKAAATAAAY